MCIELHTRYRRCKHTRLLHWTYCPILTPFQRQPSTGRACRKYKFRYKESSDATSCFECKVSEIAGWRAVPRSPPTFSNLPERWPTMSSFVDYGGTSPTSPMFACSAGEVGIGAGDRESKVSEISVAASDEPLSLGVRDCRASDDSQEKSGKEPGLEVRKGGVRGWFNEMFKAREGYDSEMFGFQRMDA